MDIGEQDRYREGFLTEIFLCDFWSYSVFSLLRGIVIGFLYVVERGGMLNLKAFWSIFNFKRFEISKMLIFFKKIELKIS